MRTPRKTKKKHKKTKEICIKYYDMIWNRLSEELNKAQRKSGTKTYIPR